MVWASLSQSKTQSRSKWFLFSVSTMHHKVLSDNMRGLYIISVIFVKITIRRVNLIIDSITFVLTIVDNVNINSLWSQLFKSIFHKLYTLTK